MGVHDMIVAVAERLVNPHLSPTDVAAWRAFWGLHTLSATLGTPALSEGPTRTRLQSLFGFSYRKPTLLVNLLPPVKVPSWEPDLAEEAAYRLHTWALLKGHKMVLLGRKVSEAFQAAADIPGPLDILGGTYTMGYVPVLCLPHPSGRSRAVNDEEIRERCRRALELFVSEGEIR